MTAKLRLRTDGKTSWGENAVESKDHTAPVDPVAPLFS